MTRAFLFPGQGSQAVGMGKALAEAFSAARDVFAEVDDALSHVSDSIQDLTWGIERELIHERDHPVKDGGRT